MRVKTEIKRIVIVGGGTAGWLTACVLAAELDLINSDFSITLVESSDINPIGVGEGTWPTMRGTLKKIGISENEFISTCDASFKQGSQFINWQGQTATNPVYAQDSYIHPFTLPQDFQNINLAPHWQEYSEQVNFADAVSSQSVLSKLGKAPKLITTPEYSFISNYGYHLDAGKFSGLLKKQAKDKLNVNHIIDNVIAVNNDKNADISDIETEKNGKIAGDLFVDCTGFASLLIGKHYNIDFISKQHQLFNNTAIAIQAPYNDPNDDIASCTLSTAQSNGWIWDIGLQSRRGVGHVFSSEHTSAEKAEQQLRQYLTATLGLKKAEELTSRTIKFNPGHRKKFWHNNCLAIGMSAGFIEPLEASALALIEQSAMFLAEQFPKNRSTMKIIAKRYNQTTSQHWTQIIEFLKLHYVLSKRTDSQYWFDNVATESIPESLIENLELWQHQYPYHADQVARNPLFPAASYQYVMFGMGFKSSSITKRNNKIIQQKAQQLFKENIQRTQQQAAVLTSNRELLNKVKKFGFAKI
ncbi:tryptophan 7-halogenase [Psychrosphaera sp. 1_MG-2023]|uniref:tryptophan halogenase family protein n=1 Tax=Psychrosphaera sp. 1_MG-2023 TaxID=3062643 RepID=UPI0026E12FA3|nr:tryptophan halogenase family protein [Psychrosphaera sp. 1_MG-2023]MDO6718463.1 tryptophan 7-halogenase [Psychrosphaera sp. 1_MG-2023]